MSNPTTSTTEQRITAVVASGTVAILTFIAAFAVLLCAALLYGPAWASLTPRVGTLGASATIAAVTAVPVAVWLGVALARAGWPKAGADQE